MILSTLLALTVLACPPPLSIDQPEKPTVSQRMAAIDAQVTLLAAQPRFTGRASGYGGVKSKAYGAFEKLLDVAEDSDLEGLLSAQSPVVRLYAFWGLVKRGHAPAGLLSRLSKPEQKVQTLWGCMGGTDTVGEVARSPMISKS